MPEPPDLNLDNILGRESKAKLSQLDPDFYDKAAVLLSSLEDEKKRTEPDSTKYEFITNRFETTKAKLRTILTARMGKIVRNANTESQKKQEDRLPETLTKEEVELYKAIENLLSRWRDERLAQMFGKKPCKKEILAEKPTIRKERVITKDYIMVRLLKDIPTFAGFDNRQYTLSKEDVAMVPTVNANALIAKKAAVQIVMK